MWGCLVLLSPHAQQSHGQFPALGGAEARPGTKLLSHMGTVNLAELPEALLWMSPVLRPRLDAELQSAGGRSPLLLLPSCC